MELVFNRTGVYISMVHILLPFMILPIYSVMKGISLTYMRAAISLGCHRMFTSFTARLLPVQPMPAWGRVACWCSSWRLVTTSPWRCWQSERPDGQLPNSIPTPVSTVGHGDGVGWFYLLLATVLLYLPTTGWWAPVVCA